MTSRWSVMCIHVTGAHYIVLRIYREDVLVQNKCVLQKISLIVGHDVLISEAGCRLRRAYWSRGAPPPPPGYMYGGVNENGNAVLAMCNFLK